ncbi:hypothetical protein NPIL_492801 [Nephila pilipes]|uniref:Uncharacterized protein n=1 Tax=Nephila pilipes TaxID=299642 RepID=A0A8X6NCE9_NEPPI|nr:hypothetical protein NPIL_492801 [Nephila pilipes]
MPFHRCDNNRRGPITFNRNSDESGWRISSRQELWADQQEDVCQLSCELERPSFAIIGFLSPSPTENRFGKSTCKYSSLPEVDLAVNLAVFPRVWPVATVVVWSRTHDRRQCRPGRLVRGLMLRDPPYGQFPRLACPGLSGSEIFPRGVVVGVQGVV